ncbi:MAG TPA: glycosyltransferase 87 family protein [Acidobacteriaceae bacterium]
MRRAKLAFLLALVVCLGLQARQVHRPNLADFEVYDAAAELVHQHHSPDMYDDADDEAVFQLKFVGPQRPLALAANRLGIARVRLYIYPPILADMLLPLVFVSGATAGKLWLLLNLAALLGTAALMVRTLDLPWASAGAAAVFAGLFALFSTVFCLEWGQVTILLLLLWMATIFLYARGRYAASAAAMALATAIKLTPLVVVVPFFVWKEWKWLRAYVAFLLLAFGLMCVVNTPASLADYIFHVMPSMSNGGIPDAENKSLLASVQLLYLTLHGASTHPVTLAVPKLVETVGKGLSLGLVLLAMLLVYRLGATMRMADRRITLALFALLSACVAPISWKHAYIVVFLALSLLWAEALRTRVSTAWLVLLTFSSIELGSFVFDSLIGKATHGVLFGLLSFLAPVTGVVLVLWRLLQMRPAPPGQEPA